MTPLLRHRGIDCLVTALLLCLLLVTSGDAGARTSDRDQELIVNADGLDGPIAQNGDTIFTDVVITQGTLRIEAARAVVSRTDGEVTKVVMKGIPAMLQQENDLGQLMTARAERIDYDTDSEIVLLTGAVKITQARDTFTGERVRYDTRNGRIQGSGGADGRIQLTIQPKKKAAEN